MTKEQWQDAYDILYSLESRFSRLYNAKYLDKVSKREVSEINFEIGNIMFEAGKTVQYNTELSKLFKAYRGFTTDLRTESQFSYTILCFLSDIEAKMKSLK